MKPAITTQSALRAAFWAENPLYRALALERGTKSKGQSAQRADMRCAFLVWLDGCEREGRVSAALAQRATL